MRATLPYRGVWISFLEWEQVDFHTERHFAAAFAEMAENCRDVGLTTLIVHVRPFADALYPSRVFPWSHLLAGQQGYGVGYDPLSVMLDVAAAEGLRLEAWINPYRILSPARPIALAESHPAMRWMEEDRGQARQRVLRWQGGLYFNPASAQVRQIICQGVCELLESYPLDGVQMDDYFYPTTDPAWDQADREAEGDSIPPGDFRRAQVDDLVSRLYRSVKRVRPQAVFGISPQGSLEANLNEQYSDVRRWLAQPGFADYLMPQLYWGFHGEDPGVQKRFADMSRMWADLPRHSGARLYAGLGAYRIGEGDGQSAGQGEWESGENLARMARYIARETKQAYQGFALFRYDSLFGTGPFADLRARERRALCALV